jgi:hypothetical protein
MGAQFMQVGREVVDERQCGFNDHLLITFLVLGEPFPLFRAACRLAQRLWNQRL